VLILLTAQVVFFYQLKTIQLRYLFKNGMPVHRLFQVTFASAASCAFAGTNHSLYHIDKPLSPVHQQVIYLQ